MNSANYRSRVELALAALGIPPELIAAKNLPFHEEAAELVLAETGADGREYLLMPAAAEGWERLKRAAQADGIVLELVSAFRGLERQCDIIRAKQQRGMPIEEILTLSAPPGYSEHHTGRAVDINTPGCEATEEPFELTPAFAWLTRHAGRFGFSMSYPRGNALGFIYEPWHWCFEAPPAMPPPPEDCCRGGCEPCVLEIHAEAMERYRREFEEWERRVGKKPRG